jgi:septal ring factor EnvC (AmiA/AmiB activator)
VQGHKDQVDSSGKPIYQQLDLSKIVPLITAAARELDQGVQGIYKRLVGIDAQVQSQARAIASVNTKTAKLEAENAQLKVKNSAKDKEIAKLKKDNAEVKARIDRIEKILLKK